MTGSDNHFFCFWQSCEIGSLPPPLPHLPGICISFILQPRLHSKPPVISQGQCRGSKLRQIEGEAFLHFYRLAQSQGGRRGHRRLELELVWIPTLIPRLCNCIISAEKKSINVFPFQFRWTQHWLHTYTVHCPFFGLSSHPTLHMSFRRITCLSPNESPARPNHLKKAW